MDVTRENLLNNTDLKQHYDVLIELGDCYASVENFEQARVYYEKAASAEPDEAGPYVGLGVVAIQQDQVDDADIAFKVALRLDRNCAKAYAGRAMVAQHRNDYRMAFDLYLKSLDCDSDNFTALLGLFQASCQIGSFEKVIYYLKVYLDSHPGDTSVMFTLASLYIKQNDFVKAQEVLRDVLVLDPENSDAAGLLEEVQRDLGRQR